jgi:hypothetical protein
MEMDLRYRLSSGVTGTGEVLNISTGGMLFRCDAPLPVGEVIRAEVTWPFLLQSGNPMELEVQGMIVRSGPEGIAVSIGRYHFRPGESSE